MKKKVHFFDTLCFLSLLSLLFVIGFHIGKEKEGADTGSVIITIEIIKSKIPDTVETFMIDGKYECFPVSISIEEKSLSFSCNGRYAEAGFLALGAKYVTKNQPIELVGKDFYVYGRIRDIKDTSSIFAAQKNLQTR